MILIIPISIKVIQQTMGVRPVTISYFIVSATIESVDCSPFFIVERLKVLEIMT
jgi:hypothetical protein